MAAVNKIDSNITGLRFADESTLGTLIGSPIWYELEPNSYNDFGGNLTTLARNPINPSRQRRKGVVVDLDAAGGFNHDFLQDGGQRILQSFMFADLRTKVEFGGSSEITNVDGTGEDFEAASGLDAFATNDLVFGKGFNDLANNGIHLVTAAAAASLTVGSDLEDETPPAGAQLIRVGVQGVAGDIDVDVTGTFPAYTSSTLDFTTLALKEGEWIFVGGDLAIEAFTTAANNGFKRVRSIAANRLEVDKSPVAMADESSTTETIRIFFGRHLRNESGTDIVRHSYNLERTLGAPDDAQPAQIQSEYITGAIGSELTLTINTADKVNYDLSFLGIDHENRTGVEGVKAGSRPNADGGDMFNTSSDFSRFKMAVHVDGDEAPSALFAFVTAANLVINNNLSPNKAVSVLGAFDVTAGTFTVNGTVTAYFSDVAAIDAIRTNSDVTLDFIMVKDNKGVAIDMPLLALGDGRLNVEQDSPITIPVSYDAASGEDIDTNLDHTLAWTFFEYLPDAADT